MQTNVRPTGLIAGIQTGDSPMTEALMVAFNKSIATEFDAKLKKGNLPFREHTPQQEAFIQAFLAQDSSILGEAVAGSGKTYVLLRSALSLPNTQWTCKTMHGLGYSAWSNKIGKRLIVKDDKMFRLLKDMEPDSEFFGDILKLAKLGKTFGIVPKIAPRGTEIVPDDNEVWEEIADQYEVEFSPYILDFARRLIKESVIVAQSGQVDFDDMIYMPVCYHGVFMRYPLVVVDEAQDLSNIQHAMLRKVLRREGILVGAGDRHQAIYGFRGALSESIPTLVESFNMSILPLTVSFRCPKSVIEEAKLDVPHIEAAESAIPGEVIRYGFTNNLELADVPGAVLCRNTAPLVSLAMRLIAEGRGAKIAGREVGKSLARLVQKICPQACSLRDFDPKLDAWIEAQIARKPKQEGSLRDKQATLKAVADRVQTVKGPNANSNDIAEIIIQLYDKNAPGAVILSTIHKAKGLEWDDVLFLDPQLVPSKYAKQPWQLQQEHNIRYVGVTRAMKRLRFARSEEII